VLRFSPTGTVKNVRQVTAQFSEPMVPLGRAFEGAMPFEVDCPEKGSARWIDTTRWVYDFAHDLPAGVRCNFRQRADLRTLSGASFAARPEFSFNTGGPAIVDSMPWQGSEDLDEQQAFVLVLDAEPDIASVIANAGFSVEGMPERIGVKVLSGADRETLLKHFKNFISNRPALILQAKQSFPDAAAISLIWGKGIKTTSGVATSQDQTLSYKTRKPFEASLRCERENAHAACIPVTPMSIWFSEPIAMALAKRVALVASDGSRIAPFIATEDQGNPLTSEVTFRAPFKESTRYKIELPPNILDDSGHPLANAARFPMTVATGEFPPLAKFSSRFGIIEAVDPVLPVTVRNLEPDIHGHQLRVDASAAANEDLMTRIRATLWRMPDPDAASALDWMRKVAGAHRADSVFGGEEKSGARQFTMPKPNGAKAFEVMGIPLKSPGFYVVELESKRLGQDLLDRDAPMYVPTIALVTDLAVHFKKGNANSLIWVTELESAKPVPDATVAIADCNGKELWYGSTDARGLAMVSGVSALNALPRCDQPNDEHPDPDSFSDQTTPISNLTSGVIVTARKGADFSFVHSSWQQGIEAWRFHLPSDDSSPNFAAHTVLDRPLFRAGETVHMKHFVRAKTLNGFSTPSADDLPGALSIQHLGGDEHYDFDLKWNPDGSAESDWEIPKTAKLGEYQITMVRAPKITATPGADNSGDAAASIQFTSGSFRVEEFRVPLMRGAIRIPTAPQVAVTSVPIDVSAEYLSGGAAKGLPVTIRSQLNLNAFSGFPDFENFTFANGTVTEGVVREGEETEDATPAQEHAGVHQRIDLTLDAAGGARTEITGIKTAATPIELNAEMEFRDPNGEAQTVSNQTTIWPSSRLVGISIPDWIAATDQPKVHLAVVDDNGKPLAGAPVNVTLFTRKRYGYRKRLIGGFYAYENITDTKRVGALCSGSTDNHGLMICDAKTDVTGNVIAQATVTDAAGHSSSAFSEFYIPGDDRFVFRGNDDDRMDVLPEQPQYQPGDTARFQVRMPFREATALVTVEREGIIAASVLTLSGKDPSITLPVRDYAPNVFVSVLVVRGRIGSIQPTAMIDLGKPAFKLGIAEIRVGWRDHELKVGVVPDRTVYHVRQKAQVKVSVRTASGAAPPVGSTIALAAVDEGLLELMHNDSWKLLDAMMGRRSYQIETSTAQMQVVGKRHYGLKAIPPGGGGGRQITRKLFDTLLMWKASVPLDANGDASIEVPLNDSLTSFRIVAIASAEAGLFGTGAATIKSTQDLMILPGISPIIRLGDAFTAEFTIRNASERPLDVAVTGKIDSLNQPFAEKLSLPPGEGKVANWNVTIPASSGDLTYHVDALAKDASDHLQVTQRVLSAVPVRTLQATLMRVDKPLEVPVAAPAGALSGVGGIVVGVRPSLVAGLEAVRQWMRDYPYTCLEQRVSRAVALHDPKLWSGVVAELPSYVDSDGLLKYFPMTQQGTDVLTAYVLAVTNEAGLKIPAPIEEQMRSGLEGFVEGKIIRDESFQTVDLPMRKLAAIEALARIGKIEPSLLGSLTIDPNLWPDSAVLDWWSILLRTPAFPDRQKRLEAAEQILRARLNSQGTAMHLSTDPSQNFWWLMVSPAENMARLTLLLVDNKLWNDDVSRVTSGLIAMQVRGNWGTTVANAWGALATEKFAATFESQPVIGETEATLNAMKQVLDWAKNPSGGNLDLAWPPAQSDLHLAQSGSGNPWAIIQANAAVPIMRPVSSGYTIAKTLTPVDSSHSGGWRQGDLVRVHLKIDAQSDMTWVVVDDPIPAGASHLGTGLQRDSQIATSGEQTSNALLMESRGGLTAAFDSDLFWPDFVERPFDAYRAYYQYIPKGSFEVEYTIRLNQAGQFQMPATRVEALYEPEMFGEIPNARFDVAP
jgi:alpha-2-macroglobulin